MSRCMFQHAQATRGSMLWLPCFLLLGAATRRLTALSADPRAVGLYRHAVKGLSADSLPSVYLQAGETFPDDRRYALLRHHHGTRFDPTDPQWLHKEHFLCAFSAPEFMAQFRSTYDDDTKHLSLYERTWPGKQIDNSDNDNAPLLGSIDLSTLAGRQALADFFAIQVEHIAEQEGEGDNDGQILICVTASDVGHQHQFGNTSSGWKRNQDTRTIHIVNAATVRCVSDALGVPLKPTRFRPNLVVDGLEPWTEFDQWVGAASSLSSSSSSPSSKKLERVIQCGTTQLAIISRTVRCEGVSIDPSEHPDQRRVLDIPKLLTQNFPQYGPYLGVYAQVVGGGRILVGDDVTLLQ